MRSYIRLFAIFVLCISSLQSHSQTDTINHKIDSLNKIGDLLFREQKYDDAIIIVKQVITIQENAYGDNTPELGITFYNLGYIYRKKGQPSLALPLWIKALPLLEKANPNYTQASGVTRYEIAEMYSEVHDYKNAVEWGEKALPYLKRGFASDNPNLLATENVIKKWRDSAKMGAMPNTNIVKKRGDAAIITPSSALKNRIQMADVDTLTTSDVDFSKELDENLRNDKTSQNLTLIRSQKSSAIVTAAHLYNKGVKLAQAYDYNGSLEYLALSGMIYSQLDTENYAKCLQWTGFNLLNLKLYKRATGVYRNCLEISKKDTDIQCWVNHDLGTVYLELGNIDSATFFLEKAVLLAYHIRNAEVAGSGLRYLGLIAQRDHKQAVAFEYLDRAKTVAEGARDTLVQIAILRDYGAMYDDLSQYEKEFDVDTTALHLAEQINDPVNLADLNFDIGKLHYMADEYTDAMNCFEAAKQFYLNIGDKEGQLKVGGALVEIYAQSPHSSHTSSIYDQLINLAKEINNQAAQATITNNYATYLSNHGDIPHSLELFNSAAKLATALDDKNLLYGINFNIGDVLFRQGKINEALPHLLAAEQLLSEVSTQRVNLGGTSANEFFFARREVLNTYRRIVQIYGLQGSFDKSLCYADKIKSQLFFEDQVSLPGNMQKGVDSALYNKELALKSNLNFITQALDKSHQRQKEIDSLVEQKREIESTLLQISQDFYSENPRLHVLQKQPVPDKQSLTKVLGANEALIEYFIGEGEVKLFLLTKTTSRQFTIQITHEDLLKKVNEIMSTVWRGQANNFNTAKSNMLFNLVLKPAINYLAVNAPHVKNLIIIGDGALNVLPFELLVTSFDKNRHNEPVFMVDRFAMRYNISASLFLKSRLINKTGQYDKDLIVVAPFTSDSTFKATIAKIAPTDEMTRWPFLKFAMEEARSIAPFFKQTSVLTDDSASSGLFIKKGVNCRFLQLSTHGYLNSSDPEYSGILLNDGLFRQYELLSSNINSDMVVLSSCESGMGQIVGSEGVMGLPRSLLTLKVNSVAASLWKVPDEATKDFMTKFYQYLSSGFSKAVALQKAKIWMKNESYQTDENNIVINNKDPMFWAPFILIESD